jgi:hypothetical protein
MGGGASRQTLYLGELEGYIKTSRSSAELSDKILTALFSVTDYTDLLALTKVDDCSRYVWVTAQAFDTLFERLQVQPVLGQSQEVRFVSAKKVIPAAGTAAAIERNKLCLNVAYIYIRIFQIYAALALTVMEANPTRLRVVVGSTGKPVAPRGQFLMTGGAKPTPAQQQEMGTFRILREYINILPESQQSKERKDLTELSFDKKNSKSALYFFYKDIQTDKSTESSSVNAIFKLSGKKETTASLQVLKTSDRFYTLTLNGVLIDTFQIGIRGDASPMQYPSLADLQEKFDEIIAEIVIESADTNTVVAPRGAAAAAPAAAAGRGTTSSTGSDLFIGYTNIRKAFTDYRPTAEGRPTATTGFFPKAYCVARAMTLLTPLFESERTDKNQPFYSQVCRRVYDFESQQELMPRTGKQPKANLYFKSLVALYYDDYAVSGGQVVATQTETGRSELREASALLAKLHRVPQSASGENFIEGTAPFRGTSLCGGTSVQPGASVLLRIKEDNFRRRIQSEIVKPMLDFQKQHSDRVNVLLKEMIQLKADGGFKFSTAITKGGRAAVNDFGRRARAMLLEYYLKSEAFYIKGVVMLEQNPGKIEATVG